MRQISHVGAFSPIPDPVWVHCSIETVYVLYVQCILSKVIEHCNSLYSIYNCDLIMYTA